MKFLRFVWKLFVMASVFGIGYIVGREHSFEEEEQWNEENGDNKENDKSEEKKDEQKPAAPEAKSETKSEAASGDTKEVTFSYENAAASKVAVVGDFNDWNKDANVLTREGDVWTAKVALKAGKHEYQFVINDTDWVVDPKAADSVNNKYEGMNSILEA